MTNPYIKCSSVSKAEIQVFQELSSRGLTHGMTTQQPIPLGKHDPKHGNECVTLPDFCWIEKRKVLFLDGVQVHRRREQWDWEVVALLEAKGWSVLRLPYQPPLSGKALTEVMEQIEKFIGEK